MTPQDEPRGELARLPLPRHVATQHFRNIGDFRARSNVRRQLARPTADEQDVRCERSNLPGRRLPLNLANLLRKVPCVIESAHQRLGIESRVALLDLLDPDLQLNAFARRQLPPAVRHVARKARPKKCDLHITSRTSVPPKES